MFRSSFNLDVTRGEHDKDRLQKLLTAAQAFDHTDTKTHNRDIQDGAVVIVCSILHSCSPFFVARAKEIQLCLTILLRLYRCSEERLCASFCTDGTNLILIFLELIEVNYRLGKKGDAQHIVLAQRVIDILCKARVPLSMVKRQEELISSLVGNVHGATGRFVMHLSMKILASLSEHHVHNRVILFDADLLDTVLVGSTHTYSPVKEESARIIMHLALEDKNKADLVQAHNQRWMDATLAFARVSCTVSTKTCAIQALRCMATIPENKIIMVQHKNGAVVETLIQVSSSRLVPSQLSINATKVLSTLTCQATASQIGHHPGLLITLSSLACREDNHAVVAAMTVKKLATHIHSDDLSHKVLLQALITMSYSRSLEVLKWTVRGLLEQASFPQDRVKMIGHKGLAASITALSMNENEFVMTHAREVLSVLATDVATARNVRVEKVLQRVSAAKECQDVLDLCRKKQPRCYSPSSLEEFHFDFSEME